MPDERHLLVVRGGAWLPALQQSAAGMGIEVEAADEVAWSRSDVLGTIVNFEALSPVEVQTLADRLMADAWVRPCVLAVERRLSPSVGMLLGSGLRHLLAMGSAGPKSLSVFRQTLAWLKGRERFSLTSLLDEKRISESHRVVRSKDKTAVIAAVGSLATRLGASIRLADTVRTATDELITNALYNAPVDISGAHRYAHLPRSEPVVLEPGEVVEVTIGVDGRKLALRVADPFGSLAPPRLLSVLSRGLAMTEIESKQGGAGLGLGWLFRAAVHLAVCITPLRSTEVLALFDLSLSNRVLEQMPRSFDLAVLPARIDARQAQAYSLASTT